MKMLISMSATVLAIGTRVAAEFEKDDWSIGTVVKASSTAYRIDFDYGETKTMRLTEGRVVEVVAPKKIKKPLGVAEVKKMSRSAIAKAKAKAEEAAKQAEKAAPAVKVLSIWAKRHGFNISFSANGYPKGFWVVEDRKLKLIAYLYDNVKLYALPPEDKTEDIEFGKAQFEYAEFNLKALNAFIRTVANKVGFKFQYLIHKAKEAPSVVVKVKT